MTRSSISARSIEMRTEYKSALRASRLRAIALVALCAAGCAPCNDDKPARQEATRADKVEPPRPKGEELALRLKNLNVDATKVYPQRADGSADCGSDLKCFARFAERSERAYVEREERTSAVMFMQHLKERYHISGVRNERCAIERAVIVAELEMGSAARAAAKRGGQSDAQIDKMLADGTAELRGRLVPRIACEMTREHALELALDLAESKATGAHFDEDCLEPAEGDPWP